MKAFTRNVNLLPKPTVDSTFMNPPSSSQIFLQMERPTPFPIKFIAWLCWLFDRLNGVKTRLTSSEFMPIPLSATSMSRYGKLLTTISLRMILIIPLVWNLTAFVSRFSKTYYILLPSNFRGGNTYNTMHLIFKSLPFNVLLTKFTISSTVVKTEPR